MPIITLTTDFGLQDGYTGVLKGVILSISPDAQIIDISHNIPPCDIKAGAWVLNNSFRFCPEGSVHVCVVDPGVGTERRGVILIGGGHTFVGPDNGLFSHIIGSASKWEVFSIDNPDWWLTPEVSTTFHGRDIFAPVAAHLSNGIEAWQFGRSLPLEDLVTFRRPAIARIGQQVIGEVVYIDHFGNLITNVPSDAMHGAVRCLISGAEVPLAVTYGSADPDAAVAYAASHGHLEIAVCQGRANHRFNAAPGTRVVLEFA